ncbi:hypothetical protein BpHYR1_022511 [Brachionus plicatilis]|uniref:Uncharacterized protein n=1 Tax=Brachionus plicatilis TaxID=10195 RepID=A0A3M7R437_BRAPC|nr:hypothetical protein BpHYR1_022511 [Brachionus plicatilis]
MVGKKSFMEEFWDVNNIAKSEIKRKFGSCPECDQVFTKKSDHRFKKRKRKSIFYKEIALVPKESSDAAKSAAKKALSK